MDFEEEENKQLKQKKKSKRIKYLILGIVFVSILLCFQFASIYLESKSPIAFTSFGVGGNNLITQNILSHSIQSIFSQYTGTYKIISTSGNESQYDVTFEEVLVDVSYEVYDDEAKKNITIERYRTDTLICMEAGWDNKQIIEYEEPVCSKTEKQNVCVEREKVCIDQRSVCLDYAQDNVTCVDLWEPCVLWGSNCLKEELQDVCVEWNQPTIKNSYNYDVPNKLSLYDTKPSILSPNPTKKQDLTKTKPNELSATSPSNPNKFCYQANPEEDFYLKFGDNSIIIVQEDTAHTDAYLDGITAEAGVTNFTHLSIDDESNPYLNFDGDDDYATMGSSPATGLTEITVSVWVYVTDGATRMVMEDGTSHTLNGFYFLLNAGKPEFNFHNGSDYDFVRDNSDTIPINSWHHVVGTWKAGERPMVYVDGVNWSNQWGVKALDGVIQAGNRELYIGGRPSSPLSLDWDGSLDEVRIYNKSLSLADINEIYNSGRVANSSLKDTNLVRWWSLDEGAGISLEESSGNGTAGTLVGDTDWSSWGLGDNLVGY